MSSLRLTADSSVIVPLLARWHEFHSRTVAAASTIRQVPAHAMVEAFSTLTRMPAPNSAPAAYVLEALRQAFPDKPFTLSADGYLSTLERLAAGGIAGGRVYDALIAATAVEAGVRLLTHDRRASRTYALMGAEFELLP